MKSVILRLVKRDEDGQGLAEYALILSLVAFVCVAAVTAFGQAVVQSLLGPAAAMFP